MFFSAGSALASRLLMHMFVGCPDFCHIMQTWQPSLLGVQNCRTTWKTASLRLQSQMRMCMSSKRPVPARRRKQVWAQRELPMMRRRPGEVAEKPMMS
jgi:hypothetical protein